MYGVSICFDVMVADIFVARCSCPYGDVGDVRPWHSPFFPDDARVRCEYLYIIECSRGAILREVPLDTRARRA